MVALTQNMMVAKVARDTTLLSFKIMYQSFSEGGYLRMEVG